MTFVADLEPRALWGRFDEILTIPRGSKNEDRVREYVIGIADELGLEREIDATGNVVVRKPGTDGRDGPPTILQAHLDMVQEKNSDVVFDFDVDAIRPVMDGEYLTALRTGAASGLATDLLALCLLPVVAAAQPVDSEPPTATSVGPVSTYRRSPPGPAMRSTVVGSTRSTRSPWRLSSRMPFAAAMTAASCRPCCPRR